LKLLFGGGVLDLYRVYTKCMKKDGNHRVRVEHQEYPIQKYQDLLLENFF